MSHQKQLEYFDQNKCISTYDEFSNSRNETSHRTGDTLIPGCVTNDFIPKILTVSSLALSDNLQFCVDEDISDSSSEPCPSEEGRENGSSSELVTAPFYLPCVRLARCSILGKATRTDKRRIFTVEQLSVLGERFDKNERIGLEEADQLASRFDSVTAFQIKTWFSNMRQQKKKENAVAMTIESSSPTGFKPSPVPLVPKAPDKNSSSLKFDPPGPVPVALQNALFEEFKKSSLLTPERKIELKTSLNVQIPRIEKFFSTMSALLRDRTKEDVSQSITAHPERFLFKIKKEYRKSRYISSWRRKQLAQQLGTDDRAIAKWFSDSRALELLSAGSHTVPVAASISPARQDRTDCVKSPVQPPNKLSAHQRHILRQEFKKTPFVPSIKARILADELNLRVERVNQFFRRKWCKSVVIKKSENITNKKCEPVESNQLVYSSQLYNFGAQIE